MQINSDQAKMIQDHLALVFVHEIDPSMGDKKHQDKLNSIHNQIPSVATDHFHDRLTGDLGYVGMDKIQQSPAKNVLLRCQFLLDPAREGEVNCPLGILSESGERIFKR